MLWKMILVVTSVWPVMNFLLLELILLSFKQVSCHGPTALLKIIINILSLLEPPSAPVITDIIVSGSRTVNISWQDGMPPIPGNPPVNAYQVSLSNSLIANVSATSVILNTLLPFTNYIVIITAMNRIGISNSSEPVLFMTDEERMFIS